MVRAGAGLTPSLGKPALRTRSRKLLRRLLGEEEGPTIGMDICLGGLVSRGFAPSSIFDVGAGAGEWTRLALRHWPDATYLLLEPLRERVPDLEALQHEQPNVSYLPAAAAATQTSLTLNVSADLNGSSFLYEGVEERPVATVRVDDLIDDDTSPPPDFMKLDVQGYELEVLAGGRQALESCQATIIEVRLFRGRPGMPMLRDLVEYMAERDFRPYEIADVLRRPLDGAQAQLDVVFAREGSALLAVEGWV